MLRDESGERRAESEGSRHAVSLVLALAAHP